MDDSADWQFENEKLLNRFRDALEDKENDDFFDEDELLDIFDLAGDFNDDYLRMEALLWGARFFPDSEALRERRAILYGDMLTPAQTQKYTQRLVSNEATSSRLTRIVDLRTHKFTQSEAFAEIKRIISAGGKLSDEEIIQIVNFAEDNDIVVKLLDILPLLRKISEYKTTLLYEVASSLMDAEDSERALPLLDELTTDEPYDVGYWTLYADALISCSKFEKANEAVEYALAVEPDNVRALEERAICSSHFGRFYDVLDIYKKNPDNFTIAEQLAFVCSQMLDEQTADGKFDRGDDFRLDDIKVLLNVLANKFPDREDILFTAIQYLPDECAKLLSKNIDQYSTAYFFSQAQSWLNYVNGFVSASNKFYAGFVICKIITNRLEIILGEKSNPHPIDFTFYITAASLTANLAYLSKRYNEAYEWVNKIMNMTDVDDPSLIFIKILSAYRLNRVKEARQIISDILKYGSMKPMRPDVTWNSAQNLSMVGLVTFCHSALPDVSNENALNEEAFRIYDLKAPIN